MNTKNKNNALVFLDNLCILSTFPLLKACLRLRPASIYYFQASTTGLKIAAWFKTLTLISRDPIKVENIFFSDTEDCVFSISMYESVKICLKYQDKINNTVDKCLPKYDDYFRQVCAVGVRKEWQVWLEKLLLQLNLAKVLGRENNVPIKDIILISQFASLLKILKVEPEISGNIKIFPQPFENKSCLYLWGPVAYYIGQVILSLLRLLNTFKKEMPIAKKRRPVVGVNAAWGLGLEESEKRLSDDFFWWRRSKISSEQLICMFDKKSFQPTRDRLAGLEKLGIQSIVLDPKYPGDLTRPEVIYQRLSLVENFKKCIFYSKLAWNGLFAEQFNRSAYSLVGWQIYKSEKLAPLYKSVNLKAVTHIHEPGLEFINLAALQNDAVRFGTHWSCFSAPGSSTPKCHEIYFVWGTHDLKIVLDSGSTSKNILVSGCIMTEQSHENEFRKGSEALQSMKNSGAQYTLTLLDNSLPLPNFYRFFLQWLVDDTNLGLLIKSKGKSWDSVERDGLEGLVERAKKTGRLYEMDRAASPGDAALLTDFAVGITSLSAIASAALKGARVLYLDFEKLDQKNLESYSTFHSLGPKRCVFYDFESLKDSILEYNTNPNSNPHLGDASPILDRLDPFRDGKASQRIGEYITWYLEGLEGNLEKNTALRRATDKYAKKWGKDKVSCGMDENS